MEERRDLKRHVVVLAASQPTRHPAQERDYSWGQEERARSSEAKGVETGVDDGEPEEGKGGEGDEDVDVGCRGVVEVGVVQGDSLSRGVQLSVCVFGEASDEEDSSPEERGSRGSS